METMLRRKPSKSERFLRAIQTPQAVVAEQDCHWNALDLLRATGLNRLTFDFWIPEQEEIRPFCGVDVDCPCIDLSAGFDAFVARKKEQGSQLFSQVRQRYKKLIREHGPARCELIHDPRVIEELINLAKDIRNEDDQNSELGLTYDEVAFYYALAINDSAKEVMGDETLRDLARILVEKVRANTSIDWTLKESVQAKLRVLVKRTLKQFGYPPDNQLLATENILKQAEMFAQEWSE